MNKKCELHLARIKHNVHKRLDEKYRKGQKEHGGCLLDMSIESLLLNALDEAFDQVTYLLTALENYRKEKDGL